MSENDNGEIKTILESLKEKFEKGEISKEEYESLKAKYKGPKPERLQFSLIEVNGSAKITSEYISVSKVMLFSVPALFEESGSILSLEHEAMIIKENNTITVWKNILFFIFIEF